jgi:hypothetical protein
MKGTLFSHDPMPSMAEFEKLRAAALRVINSYYSEDYTNKFKRKHPNHYLTTYIAMSEKEVIAIKYNPDNPISINTAKETLYILIENFFNRLNLATPTKPSSVFLEEFKKDPNSVAFKSAEVKKNTPQP